MNGKAPRILVVDDEGMIRDALREMLSTEGLAVQAVENAIQALAELEKQEADVVLADLTLPRVSGLELLDRIRQSWPQTEVIVITGQASIATAVDAIKRGAYHYVTKPFTADEILHLVGQALERRRLVDRKERLEEELSQHRGVHQLVGQSEPIRRIRSLIQTAAGSDATVLIQGESGTGKEIVANAIHAQSKRRRGPLVKMNCAAVPETLLESELFGHEKGAFTGADRRRIGRFEQADSGTLFLDEVCEMHPRLQAKFLRALQEREIERLGGSPPIPVDVRIIAATNRVLQQAIEAGDLREDLYYRLNVILLQLPPLRERMDDVPILAMHFLRKYAAREGNGVTGITEEAMNVLLGYPWPGNVRELENAIERAVVLAQVEQLRPQELPPQVHDRNDDRRPLVPAHLTLEEIEKLAIAQALRLTGGNKSEAAERLGIHRTSLYDKIRRYGIAEGASRHGGAATTPESDLPPTGTDPGPEQ
jgi:two-component system response regulator HydG